MNVDDLTIGQAKQLSNIFGQNSNAGLQRMMGEKVIVRTYSAGCWFGELSEKSGEEVILKDARRMWLWWAKQSISLSAVAKYGVIEEKSKIVEAVNSVWLKAIEIIPCSTDSVKSLEGAENVEAE